MQVRWSYPFEEARLELVFDDGSTYNRGRVDLRDSIVFVYWSNLRERL